MSNKISLHIGINEVDPGHYLSSKDKGWKGELDGCESDALAMKAMATAHGFQASALLTRQATRKAVQAAIREAARTLPPGGHFLLTYSGHGSQVRDVSGDELEDADLVLASPSKSQKQELGAKGFSFGEEPASTEAVSDNRDETWCLYDKQLLDDELWALWAEFQEGVNILIFSDSCHSGTVSKGLEETLTAGQEGMQPRIVPRATLGFTYRTHKDFYDGLQLRPDEPRPVVKARVRLFSGCLDQQSSFEDTESDPPQGYFTRSVLKALEEGAFANYDEFFERIKANLDPGAALLQTPHHTVFGGKDGKGDGRLPFFGF
ncbi:MAG: caspase family protein [Phaeodactylibacter sp.]|nr:caspase family protein [Phaeodactylibacter sp.]MCB9049267.1 caspase family protein [Lewinellaceae bacterium]